jgi:hypothetical protein
METPQHLFALTRPEQRVAVLIILGLLLVAAFGHYHRGESNLTQPVPIHAKPDSKPPADENSEEE